MMRLQIVGGGQMGGAIAEGLVDSGWATAAEIHVVDPSDSQRSSIASRIPGLSVGASLIESEGTILAVKPHMVADVIPAVVAAGSERLLSIAAGVTLGTMSEASGTNVTVLRAMPNTPALAGSGTSALCAPEGTPQQDIVWATELLEAVGAVYVVSESQMDAVTAVSGSGPAYLFMVAEAMIEGAVLAGLPRDLAVGLVNSTIRGSGELLVTSDRTAADLRASVTSPGGTTAAALAVLEDAGLRSGFLQAIGAAKARSKELG